MADNKLNVEIGATTKGLEKGLAVALKELDKLKDEQKQLNDAFKKGEISSKKYYKGLSQNALKLKSASAAVNKYKGNVSGLGKATSANATPALQEFSRVIQDAPFGIQGVANNITQLTSQFGYLSKNTGGAGAALKAMASSLMGPAGVLFAVSAVTSLWVAYEKEIKEFLGTQNRLIEATKDYVSEAKTEILTLNQLVSIARDENNSKKLRQGAIDEINKNYKKYLGNLDLESVKTDTVTKSVEALSKALIIQAKVKGIADLIAERGKETTGEILLLEEKRVRTEDKLATLQKEASKNNLRQRQGLKKALERINEELDTLEKKAASTLNPLLKIQETLKKAGFETTPQFDAEAEKANKKAIAAEEKKNASLLALKTKLFDQIAAEEIKANETSRNDFIKQWEKVDLKAVNPFAGMSEEINAGFEQILADYQAFQSQMNIIGSAIENTAKDIGASIGNALASGGNVLNAAVGALVNGLGGLLSAMGDYLIEAGTAAVLAGTVMQLFGTVSGIGAGLAAIGGGIALKAIGGAFSGLGSGIQDSGNTSSVAGGGRESSGYSASSRGGGGSNAGGTYVFEIAGTKLVGVLQNTLERNRSLGGTNKLTFSS